MYITAAISGGTVLVRARNSIRGGGGVEEERGAVLRIEYKHTHSMYVCLFAFLSVCLSVYVCASVCMFVYIYVYMYACVEQK
jgi:hypothetical protein